MSISYAPIRRYARSDASLLGRMLQGLSEVARRVPHNRRQRLQVLRMEAGATLRAAADLDELDRRLLDREMALFNAAATRNDYPSTQPAHAPTRRV